MDAEAKIDARCLYRLFDQNDSDEGRMNILRFCMDKGLITSKYECPKCGNDMVLRTMDVEKVCDGYEWTCRVFKRPGRHIMNRSVRRGSLFDKSTLKITEILIMNYYFLHQLPFKFIEEELSLSENTVSAWRNIFREVCLSACMEMNEPIGGPGMVVELVQCTFKMRKCLFSGVEKDSNKCFMKVIDTRDKDKDAIVLLNVIKTFILPGTIVYSTCWKSYECLEDDEFQFLTKNQTYRFVNLDTSGILSAVKRTMPQHNSRIQLESYLGEYLWRKAHSDTTNMLAFFEAVKLANPPFSRDLLPEEVEDD